MHILALILKWLGVAEEVATETLQVVGHATAKPVPPTATAILKGSGK